MQLWIFQRLNMQAGGEPQLVVDEDYPCNAASFAVMHKHGQLNLVYAARRFFKLFNTLDCDILQSFVGLTRPPCYCFSCFTGCFSARSQDQGRLRHADRPALRRNENLDMFCAMSNNRLQMQTVLSSTTCVIAFHQYPCSKILLSYNLTTAGHILH